MVDIRQLAIGLVGQAYPLIEPLTDEAIEEVGDNVGDVVAKAVNDTETKWDNEAAEKLAGLLRSVADSIDAKNGPGVGGTVTSTA